MQKWQERTGMLFGEDGLAKLASAHVVLVGAGGVGAYAAEMLARAGVGHMTIIDEDEVGESNINRQLLALRSTIGRPKVEVLRERLLDINPEMEVSAFRTYVTEELLLSEESSSLIPVSADSVVDAIDTLSPKIALIQYCLRHSLPLVSSMGSGAKTDATAVRIADISKTYQCPLAHMLRKRLHRLGIHSGFQAVFSAELPRKDSLTLEESRNKKSQVGTVSYMPAVFGCACAQAAIDCIIK